MLPFMRVSLTIVILSLFVLACALPVVTLPDSDANSTAVAQTVIAGLVQSALTETIQPTLQSQTHTFTPEPIILSATSPATPTQTFTLTPASTATPVVPQISVSVPTNCRVGPGKVYRRVGALLVGETAQVFGRDPTGRYWYIRNPDSGADFCWAWGEYASVVGNTTFLPIYTPPPTPTPTFTPTPSPDFRVAFTGLDSCVGWWSEFELENTGSIPFKSMGITVKDTVTNVVVANFVDGFTNIDGCLSSVTRDILGVGKSPVISSPAFNYNPSGHKLIATLILCSQVGQRGFCVTRSINFTP